MLRPSPNHVTQLVPIGDDDDADDDDDYESPTTVQIRPDVPRYSHTQQDVPM